MTIITKSTAGDKKLLDEDALVDMDNLPMVDEDKFDLESTTPTIVQTTRTRRVKNSVTLCVFFVALLVVIIGTLGGIHFYRQMAKERIYHSSINLPIDHPIHEGEGWNTYPGLHQQEYQRLLNAQKNRRRPYYFHEEFNIDLESEEFERITVTRIPKVFNGRRGHFIHLFSLNKTGIVDIDARRCFIMPLDRSQILAPRVLFEVMVKLKANYYKVDTKIIRQKLRVIHPPIKDYQTLGYYIARDCVGFKTFRLERMTTPVFKRSVQDEADEEDALNFIEFAGNLMQYSIFNAEEA